MNIDEIKKRLMKMKVLATIYADWWAARIDEKGEVRK